MNKIGDIVLLKMHIEGNNFFYNVFLKCFIGINVEKLDEGQSEKDNQKLLLEPKSTVISGISFFIQVGKSFGWSIVWIEPMREKMHIFVS